MKLIGIDYGRRRIGLSISDETATLVRGLTTIDRKKTADCIEMLRAIILREKADGIVIGLPLGNNEQETAMSLEVRKFAANLEKNLTIPVYYIDESLTSKQAANRLQFRPKKYRRDKANTDRMAACLILESFLRDTKCMHVNED